MPSQPRSSGTRRRALAHQGGPTESRGEPEMAAALASALQAVEAAPSDPLTHGFHAYPARMHYAIARHVLARITDPRTRVLDPCCGSGTVLVEARRLGLRACGVDLNPLALRLAEVKTAWRSPEQRQAFAQATAAVVEASLDRVSRRVRVLAPLSAEERRWYQPHVLLELGGLHAEIEALPEGFDRRALQMVLSSIVLKFSRQRSETTARESADAPRIGKKIVTDFFGRKAAELSRRWADLAAEAPAEGPEPRIEEGDVRDLRAVVGKWRFDLVLSSPPYGGTYDYVDHHARRYPWLGLDPEALRRGELGARRDLSPAEGGTPAKLRAQWDRQIEQMLQSIARVLSPRGRVVLLVGDGEVGGQRVAADRQLETLAATAGLEVVAVASQPRPDWGGKAPRNEHLVALGRES